MAQAAEVDPALVMQYYGSKQRLFDAAVRVAEPPAGEAGPEELIEELLGSARREAGRAAAGESLAMVRLRR